MKKELNDQHFSRTSNSELISQKTVSDVQNPNNPEVRRSGEVLEKVLRSELPCTVQPEMYISTVASFVPPDCVSASILFFFFPLVLLCAAPLCSVQLHQLKANNYSSVCVRAAAAPTKFHCCSDEERD